ncbi:MAG: gfo/Idh/MocA family oxidoreductase [Spirochaetaceae bacterium]|nr:MAG: gfo/Idh/MocA family oxidoreductase [Spirochaetaceae bacterium]
MSREPVRCAIVGLGRIGSLLERDARREKPCTHAGAVVGNPDCRLVGGCDTDAERRAEFTRDWGCTVVCAGIDELLEASRPDILCVATHPDSHRLMVERALAHGVRVAVCEKPLADTLRNARAIARLHQSGRITVVTNHERRYSADYRRAREIVCGGQYGDLVAVRAALYFGRTAPHDRVLLHDGTHIVDIINYLTGGELKASGRFGALRSNRSSVWLAATGGAAPGGKPRTGVPVMVEVGAERDHLVFEVELSLERGRVTVGNGVFRVEESQESPFYEGYRSLVDTGEKRPEVTGYFSGMMADAVACLREPGRAPVSSARDGLAVMRFIRSAGSRLQRAIW